MNDNRDKKNMNPRDIRFDIDADDTIKSGRPDGFELDTSNDKENIFVDSSEDEVQFDLGEFKPKKVRSALTDEDISADDNLGGNNLAGFNEAKTEEKPLENLFTPEKFSVKKDISNAKTPFDNSENEDKSKAKKRPMSRFGTSRNASPDDTKRKSAIYEETPTGESKLDFLSEKPKTEFSSAVEEDNQFPYDNQPPRAQSLNTSAEDIANAFKTKDNGQFPIQPQQENPEPKIASPLPMTTRPSGIKPITADELMPQDGQSYHNTTEDQNDVYGTVSNDTKLPPIEPVADSEQVQTQYIDEPIDIKTSVIPAEPENDEQFFHKREKPKFVINPVPISPEIMENRKPVRPKKRRKKKKKKTSVLGMCVRISIALMLLSALMVGTMGIVYAMGDLLGLKESEEIIEVNIAPDTPVTAVAETLKANGIINYPQVFKLYIKFYLDNNVSFKFGTFTLHPSMAYDEIIKTLEEATGNNAKLRFTIREGENISSIADDLQSEGICQRDEFLEAIKSHPFENNYFAEVTNLEQRYYRLEGYLFPNTYEFVQNTPPDDIINTLLAEFTNQIDANNIYNQTADLDRILRIASIVQAEAPTKQEMMKVASIYWNRINNPDMFSMLQSDPTSKYAERVLVADGASAEIANAYDTYKAQGLPPGPINNPGMQAIIATLYPANTNYYYFCTDSSGAFYYATTYEEHQSNLALAGIDENNLD